MTLTIDVVSDVVCPWCFVGKRRLEAALVQWRQIHPDEPEPAVRWLPFELNPALPATGMERSEYMRGKFGTDDVNVLSRVADAGKGAGIGFRFERIVRQPNTRRLHLLIELAGEHLRQDALVERLFDAYFLEGVDLTSAENLKALAVSVGLDGGEIDAALTDSSRLAAIAATEDEVRNWGVEGVPFFVFGGRLAVSGAHEPAALVAAMEQARTRTAA